MIIEEKFKNYFDNKIAQVFLYLTDTCNLRCKQCLYKTELTFQLEKKEIPYNQSLALIENLYSLGARKITFMGGEPTLYKQLPELISFAKKTGYTYIRIDTNGTFSPKLLESNSFKDLNEITFSLDGYSKEMNDKIRGDGVFEKCVNNIRLAVSKGYETHVTTCVHNEFTKKIDGNNEELELIKMIKFLKSLGVKKVNMHDLFKAGIPRDVWSGSIDTSVDEYMNAYKTVLDFKQETNDNSIRMPQCVTTKKEFDNNPEYYGYCSVKQYDRILAFPNGMLRVCSLMIGSPYCVGYYDENKIYWNETPTNEVLGHEMTANTKCTNQGKGSHFGKNFVPLCVSFKPKQDEPVWVDMLKWEDKRK